MASRLTFSRSLSSWISTLIFRWAAVREDSAFSSMSLSGKKEWGGGGGEGGGDGGGGGKEPGGPGPPPINE